MFKDDLPSDFNEDEGNNLEFIVFSRSSTLWLVDMPDAGWALLIGLTFPGDLTLWFLAGDWFATLPVGGKESWKNRPGKDGNTEAESPL